MDGKFWVYEWSAKWIQDRRPDSPIEQEADLPDGRMRNSSSHRSMFREEKSEEEMKAWAEKSVHESLAAWAEDDPKRPYRSPTRNVTDLEIEVRFIHKADWCLDWFSHWTFDDGQSDEEVLASFAEYVAQAKAAGYDESSPYPIMKIQLMGAEDRWRWKGQSNVMDEDGRQLDADAPCRCKNCKKHGVIRIDH